MSEIKLLDKIRKDEQIINDLNDNLDSPNYKFSIGKYQVLTHIDSGNFGSVFKGFDTQNQKPVAIKIINIQQMIIKHPSESTREKLKRYLQTEQLLMKKCRSAFVVKLYDSYQNNKCKVLIMEYCRNGSLEHFIRQRDAIEEEDAVTILRQIILGVSELHRNNIIHRDLKPANILIHNDVFKIADFGLSKQVKDASVQEVQTNCGSIPTMAPEVARSFAYGFKADIWSLGIIYFMMIYHTQKKLNQRYKYAIDFAKDVGKFNFKSITGKYISEESSNFLKRTIIEDCSKRMNWEQTLEHPLFKIRFERMPSVYLAGLDDAFAKQLKNKIEIVADNALELQKELIDFEKLRSQSQKMIAESQGLREEDLVWQLDSKILNEQYLQCRISEFIYYEIFLPIEKKTLLKKDVRFHVEFMFLLLNRCKENIISAKTIVDRKYPEEIAILFCNQVSPLFQIISEKIDEIGNVLAGIQSKFSSIIKDRISKIFYPQIFQEKEKFLKNFQRTDFIKSQQLRFTCERYILDIVNQIKGEPKLDQIKMKKLLKSYKQINEIKLQDLNEKRIQERINSILNQNQ